MQSRYPSLALLSVLLRIVALVTAVGGTIIGLGIAGLALLGITSGLPRLAGLPGILLGLSIIVGTLVSALATAASADLCDLLISIERSVRRRLRHPDQPDELEERDW